MAEPTRMCISCRGRFSQADLIRLQYDDTERKIRLFTGTGRSFYICCDCIKDDKIYKSICKVCRIPKEESQLVVKELKERLDI